MVKAIAKSYDVFDEMRRKKQLNRYPSHLNQLSLFSLLIMIF